jgi:hypothetical protein
MDHGSSSRGSRCAFAQWQHSKNESQCQRHYDSQRVNTAVAANTTVTLRLSVRSDHQRKQANGGALAEHQSADANALADFHHRHGKGDAGLADRFAQPGYIQSQFGQQFAAFTVFDEAVG